jgi:hypothetical protein
MAIESQHQTIRDRLWLWGMKVNILQELSDFAYCKFKRSTLTVEQAIQKTGITNIILAGHLDIARTSLEQMPSAKRIICKWTIHQSVNGKNVLREDECLDKLLAAKSLAREDPRIEAFHVDDFSTGSIDAGISIDTVHRLQMMNATCFPQLPLGATIYPQSLDVPALPQYLPHFGYFLVPLWFADQIDTLSDSLDRLSVLSGGKPMLLCLYCFDFGKNQFISQELMARHLETARRLILDHRVTGLCLCGTCLMDLELEANRCFFDWAGRAADQPV